VPGADAVGNVAEDDGDNGSTTDGRDEKGGTTFGVTSKATKSLEVVSNGSRT